MKQQEIKIDLSRPPTERWKVLENHQQGMEALFQFFAGEIIDMMPSSYEHLLTFYASTFMSVEHRGELRGISELTGIPLEQVLMGNLYYDALKIALGCSAFSVNTDNGPVHGRNLDWYSNENDLSKYSIMTRFVNGKNEYVTVGWPGFTGCLSGMAIGKFSVTLNAVWSDESISTAEPVVYLIRKVLESAENFEEAVHLLSTIPIASDCLLMVCGVRESEMVVIERTPTKAMIRWSENGNIRATNDYKLIGTSNESAVDALTETSCGRYNRMGELLKHEIASPLELHGILNDPKVRMEITMQQMYFHPKTGEYGLFD